MKEIKMRDKCIASISTMLDRQPLSDQVMHDLSLNLFRQTIAWRRIGNVRRSSDVWDRLTAIPNWHQLKSFEIRDKINLVMLLCDIAMSDDSRFSFSPSVFEQVTKNAIAQMEAYNKNNARKLRARDWLLHELFEQDVAAFTQKYPQCEPKIRKLISLLDMSGLHQSNTSAKPQPSVAVH